ncbi:MAG TPA: hypothetical protein VMW29_04250 [Candidatus Bathyarchaeia archaeon]|nr:hypothetical protein [Candidatus Bathyarchaeia archaeon]
MNKKDVSWLFILLIIVSINSSGVLFQKGQTEWGGLIIVLGIIFLLLSLIFYFKSRQIKTTFPVFKKIIIIFFAVLGTTLLLSLFVPVKSRICQDTIETEIKQLLSEQEKIAGQMEEFKNQNQVEQVIGQIPLLKKNIVRAIELNQQLISLASGNRKQELFEREKILKDNLNVFEKMEECASFYPSDKNYFNQCQKQVDKMIKNSGS